MYGKRIFICLAIIVFARCKETSKPTVTPEIAKKDILLNPPKDIPTPKGMVWVQGRRFKQGAKPMDAQAMPIEKPEHDVIVDGFFIDITEVTNKQFAAFVDATNYKTVAERPLEWEEIKRGLPQGTPKPHDSIFRPGSLVFNDNVTSVTNFNDYGQWWIWKPGANWRNPQGPGSTIENKGNLPVIHIAYEDAVAYCEWANRKLPTEAQWEAAAQGNNGNTIFTWGNDLSKLSEKANTWDGNFPIENTGEDNFVYIAPVKSYDPNSIGIYDMIGNVWEWTQDTYNTRYYQSLDRSGPTINPMGATTYYNPQNPYATEKIIKGGSYLCHASYCGSYRVSARMATTLDSGSDHVGFRTIVTVAMLAADGP